MKIALIGYGKMGRMVEEVARRQSIEVAAHFTSSHPLRPDDETRQVLAGIDVLIDFSAPSAVLANIEGVAGIAERGQPCPRSLVIGTTGWHHRLEEAAAIASRSNLGIVYGSNFSLGVNLFYKIVETAAQLFSAFPSYDPFLEEAHHKHKKDAPSGTALVLQKIVTDKYGERPAPVTSVRAGYIPGMHAVSFDSAVDTIRLEHTSRNREGFAEGALLAAKWIVGRKGIFEFREALEAMMRATEEQIPKSKNKSQTNLNKQFPR